MTRKEFTKRCKEIKASKELTRAEKAAAIKHEAALFTDRFIENTPEMRDFWRRNTAAEQKLAGHGGFSFCPKSGTWYPSRPPKIQALDQEYVDLTQRMADEVFRKAWTGKAA
jgi:hypothetical protein